NSFGYLSWLRDADGNGQADVIEVNIPELVGASCTSSDMAHWADAAVQAAKAQGVPVDLYQHKLFLLPNEVPCAGGVGEMGCWNDCYVWQRNCSWPDLYIHELGHNLGLHHARVDSDNNGTPESEYGDASCPMGYSGIGFRHFNALHKRM